MVLPEKLKGTEFCFLPIFWLRRIKEEILKPESLQCLLYSWMLFKMIIPLKPCTWKTEWKIEGKKTLYLKQPQYLAASIMKMSIFRSSTELWDCLTPCSSSQRGINKGIEGKRVVVCTFLSFTRATQLWFVSYTGVSLALFWRKSSRTKWISTKYLDKFLQVFCISEIEPIYHIVYFGVKYS